MRKHNAGHAAALENPNGYRGVQLWLLRLRQQPLREVFDSHFGAVLNEVRAVFSEAAAAPLRKYLVRSRDQVRLWSAAHSDRAGCLFVFTSNPCESWHARLKDGDMLDYKASLVAVFKRTTTLEQKHRADQRELRLYVFLSRTTPPCVQCSNHLYTLRVRSNHMRATAIGCTAADSPPPPPRTTPPPPPPTTTTTTHCHQAATACVTTATVAAVTTATTSTSILLTL